MPENIISTKLIGLAIEVHTSFGPACLRAHTKNACINKIGKAGLGVEKEKPTSLIFEEVKLECRYRIDQLVENKVVIEIKNVKALNDVHLAQTLTYMGLGNYKLGLLMNFNVFRLKDGIKRVVNGL
jgi:GxxExxY protein